MQIYKNIKFDFIDLKINFIKIKKEEKSKKNIYEKNWIKSLKMDILRMPFILIFHRKIPEDYVRQWIKKKY